MTVEHPDALLDVALAEAVAGRDEGGVPIGAALFHRDGRLLAAGRNGSVQHGDFLAHAETTAVRAAGELDDYRDVVLVTTMTPCWYCAGLVRFLGIGTVVVGDTRTWSDESLDWLEAAGVTVVRLDDERCHRLFADWLATEPASWVLPSSVDGWAGSS